MTEHKKNHPLNSFCTCYKVEIALLDQQWRTHQARQMLSALALIIQTHAISISVQSVEDNLMKFGQKEKQSGSREKQSA